MTVINQALFETPNLTINSTVHFTQNASSFGGTNVPALKLLEINTNGVLKLIMCSTWGLTRRKPDFAGEPPVCHIGHWQLRAD